MITMTASSFWEEAWKYAAMHNDRTHNDKVEEAFWEKRSPIYDEKNPLAPFAKHVIEDVLKKVNRQDRIIEIGPGTGGFTEQLFPFVSNMTVVEPSKAMLDQFLKKWKGDRPDVIQAKWEEANVEKVDIIFGANAFYRMKKMKEALLKMNAIANKYVFLVQSMSPFAEPLQAVVEGERIEVERADAIAKILDELNLNYIYKKYKVTRVCGRTHDLALIYWKTKQIEEEKR